MFAAMQDAGLIVPGYHVDIAQVKVTLRRFGLMDPDTREWLTTRLGMDYRPTAGIALVLARDLGIVSISDLRTQTAKDSDDLRELLTDLADRGALVETATDHYRLPGPTDNLSVAEQAVLAVVSTTTALTAKEISEATHRTVNTIRPVLRKLVDDSLLTATAPVTSRNRSYLRSES